jgi:hypothetical protein
VQSGFPALDSKRVEIWLQSQPTLACVADEGASACIRLHAVLNHHHTPERVIAFIVGHELLHLVVPPREVDGALKTHPPEFWESERRMFPDRGIAWSWMILVLNDCLRTDKRQECTFVKTTWKRRMRSERPTLELLAANLERGAAPAKEPAERLL